MYSERTYRRLQKSSDLVYFQVTVKETDLYIGVDQKSYLPELEKQVKEWVWALRRDLEEYIKEDQQFRLALRPYFLLPSAPPLAQVMAEAAWKAGVGPMAAVAGAFAEAIGRLLLTRVKEVLVENGGDIFLQLRRRRRVGIWAGNSPFSGRVALEIEPSMTPLGVCTSSGTVGPSLSFGKADAAVVLASSAALADAAATAVGNVVKSAEDIEAGLKVAQGIKGVIGAVVIVGDRMGAWGKVKLVPIEVGEDEANERL